MERAAIEATPAMIGAGHAALLSWDSRDFPDVDMVIDVFNAMLTTAPDDWFERLEAWRSQRRISGS